MYGSIPSLQQFLQYYYYLQQSLNYPYVRKQKPPNDTKCSGFTGAEQSLMYKRSNLIFYLDTIKIQLNKRNAGKTEIWRNESCQELFSLMYLE